MNFSPKQSPKIPEIAGVYLFRNTKDKILYIGKAKNLKKRVGSYFMDKKNREAKISVLVGQTATIEVIPLTCEFEALLLEAALIKKNKPKYNVIWKDDKHYIYIKITNEEFPRVLFSRREDEEEATLFGPFPSKKTVKEILHLARNVFPYCSQKANARKACFHSHLGLCHPCPAEIRKKKGNVYLQDRKLYLSHIRQIKALLGGKMTKVHLALKKQMTSLSSKKEFEKAASVRDKLQRLDYLVSSYQGASAYIESPDLTYKIWRVEQRALIDLLKNYFPKISKMERVECYDVSNISGKFAVGSMITFIDGQPAKSFYRRFRIKTVQKQDDFSMLSEIITRRLSHRDWKLPDLLVIDGGKAQLLALKKTIHQTGVSIPMIGLAKREEEIVIPKEELFVKIKLPRGSHALNLIQRLRDEAHRFAHRYHERLRLKYLMSYD